ncbi:MAG TPA: hypothetical protein VK588_12680 [Chitinophagaceae bacterium]|nr:hypothetical protein [Chitinophagaceae bacterium]
MADLQLSDVRDHVINCFQQDTPGFMHYHNLSHTKTVVIHCQVIGLFYQLPIEDHFALLTAAWFHDLGQLYSNPADHEIKSAELMNNFMQHSYSPSLIQKISDIVLATRQLSQPKTLLQEIIRDSDTYHFGTDEFFSIDTLVKREFEERNKQKIANWPEHTLNLLLRHQYYTAYCQKKLNAGKDENIIALEKKVRNPD